MCLNVHEILKIRVLFFGVESVVFASTRVVATAMALPLAIPKGFKFHRLFSRPESHAIRTSQLTPPPPPHFVVPCIQLEGVELPTLIGENTPK